MSKEKVQPATDMSDPRWFDRSDPANQSKFLSPAASSFAMFGIKFTLFALSPVGILLILGYGSGLIE